MLYYTILYTIISILYYTILWGLGAVPARPREVLQPFAVHTNTTTTTTQSWSRRSMQREREIETEREREIGSVAEPPQHAGRTRVSRGSARKSV